MTLTDTTTLVETTDPRAVRHIRAWDVFAPSRATGGSRFVGSLIALDDEHWVSVTPSSRVWEHTTRAQALATLTSLAS